MFSAGSCFNSELGAHATRCCPVVGRDDTPLSPAAGCDCADADIARAALTIADCQWRGRRGGPAAHARIRNRSLCRRARGRSRARRRRPAARARFPPVQSLGFSQPRDQPRLSAGSQAHAGCAAASPTGSSCWATTSRSRATICSRRPGAAARRGPGVPSALLRRGWIKPWPAGAYLIKARKRVYTLTPIRPKSRERAQAIGGLVKPTSTRSSS